MDTKAILYRWRTKVLNGFLTIVAIAAAPAWAMVILGTVQTPERRLFAVVFTILFATLIALAVFRNLDSRWRAWGVLLLGYSAATINVAINGLRGAGPWYLLVLPIVGLIFIGVHSGILLSILSALITAIFVILFDQGILVGMESTLSNPWSSFTTLLMLLAIEMALLILFYRFQEKTIEKERHEHAELIRARVLLEQEKANLEQNVRERTEQLEHSNKIQTALYKITDAASASQSMEEFYAQVHQVIGELMYAGNIFIAHYDENTGLLSFPYFVDEKDEPFPTQPLEDFHGMTSYMIRTGKSIQHGWDQFNELIRRSEVELEGSYN